ncbi:MAG: hypothetical protein EYX74_06300 [Desulfobulbaceae bacterium]|nr:MAG: hypothetical protein EYX74_06300 [Desulfobulbaceae bacterium]
MSSFSAFYFPDTLPPPAVLSGLAALSRRWRLRCYHPLADDDPVPAPWADFVATGQLELVPPPLVDPELIARLRSLIRELDDPRGETALFMTHNLVAGLSARREETAPELVAPLLGQFADIAADQAHESLWQALLLLKLAEKQEIRAIELTEELRVVETKKALLWRQFKDDDEANEASDKYRGKGGNQRDNGDRRANNQTGDDSESNTAGDNSESNTAGEAREASWDSRASWANEAGRADRESGTSRDKAPIGIPSVRSWRDSHRLLRAWGHLFLRQPPRVDLLLSADPEVWSLLHDTAVTAGLTLTTLGSLLLPQDGDARLAPGLDQLGAALTAALRLAIAEGASRGAVSAINAWNQAVTEQGVGPYALDLTLLPTTPLTKLIGSSCRQVLPGENSQKARAEHPHGLIALFRATCNDNPPFNGRG